MKILKELAFSGLAATALNACAEEKTFPAPRGVNFGSEYVTSLGFLEGEIVEPYRRSCRDSIVSIDGEELAMEKLKAWVTRINRLNGQTLKFSSATDFSCIPINEEGVLNTTPITPTTPLET